jgi:predicted DNA-binding protein (UPF0251 family)
MTDFIWGKTILTAYKYIDKAAQRLDELTLSGALRSGGCKGDCRLTTAEQVERVLDLVNKKTKLCNLKIIIDETLNRFAYEEQLLLKLRYVRNMKFETFSNVLKFTKRTYFRHLEEALKKFCAMLCREGYDNGWFEREYLDQKWIKRIKTKMDEKEKFGKEFDGQEADEAGADEVVAGEVGTDADEAEKYGEYEAGGKIGAGATDGEVCGGAGVCVCGAVEATHRGGITL